MKFIFAFAFLFFTQLASAQVHTPGGKTDAMACLAASKGGVILDAEIDKCLKTNGVRFEVHGISLEDQTAVITFRDPANFFIYKHFSLITRDSAIQTAIFSLHRHDAVIIKGSLARFHAPQSHVLATSIVMETASNIPDGMPDYKYETPPEDVLSKTNISAVVHGVFENGAVLVVEYGDRVIPVYVEPRYTVQTKDLYRSDVINMNYVVQDSPGHPIHLNLTGTVNGKPVPAVTVTESILAQSGKTVDMTGDLVLYPKSPQIPFNVFALKQDLGNNLRRYYTLVNLADAKVFEDIRNKLQASWDAETSGRRNDRNKWINTNLKVHARGVSNTQDPNQANPQILLENADDVEVLP